MEERKKNYSAEVIDVEYGTYTPTETYSVNASATTIYDFIYFRVGNVVQVTGRVVATFSSTSAAIFTLTIPIASNFTSVLDAQGVAKFNTLDVSGSNFVQAQTSSDGIDVNCKATSTGAKTMIISFMYVIK
jgi:hypothetical protein